MKKDYELIFIYNSRDSVFEASRKKIQDILSQHKAKIIKEEDMGIRKLAYEVKKNKEGHYYLYHLRVNGEKIKQMSRDFRLSEEILKHMFVRKDYIPPRQFRKKPELQRSR